MYKLTLSGMNIDSLGGLLGALIAMGDGDAELSDARKCVEGTTFELGCFISYELYLTNRFGSPTRHPSGLVAFCEPEPQMNNATEITVNGAKKDMSDFCEVWGLVTKPISHLSGIETKDIATANASLQGKLNVSFESLDWYDEFSDSNWVYDFQGKSIECRVGVDFDLNKITVVIDHEINGVVATQIVASRTFS